MPLLRALLLAHAATAFAFAPTALRRPHRGMRAKLSMSTAEEESTVRAVLAAAASPAISRRAAATLLALGSLAVSGPGGAAAARCAPRRLLASREQLDLAVQASSVQAWGVASDVARDPLLDPSSLAAALDDANACPRGAADGGGGGGETSDDDATRRKDQQLLAGVADLRLQLRALSEGDERGGGGATAEQVMRAMQTGTSARNAIDDSLRRAGVADDGT